MLKCTQNHLVYTPTHLTLHVFQCALHIVWCTAGVDVASYQDSRLQPTATVVVRQVSRVDVAKTDAQLTGIAVAIAHAPQSSCK